MANTRIITARKRSEDPAQEHLRENKSEWNKHVSEFIRRVKTFTSSLVDLKRAMNGWPVPELGLERSSVKNPLSPIVPKLLDGLANEYQSLAQDYQGLTQSGKSIVQEQEQYSGSRRKSRSETPISGLSIETEIPSSTPTVASMNNNLIKEGSNPLGRLWTYIKTPFMFGDEDRYARRDMLKSSAVLHKLLGDVGKNIVSRDKNAIPEAVYRTQQFIAQFNSEITQPLLALNEAKAIEQEFGKDQKGLPEEIPPTAEQEKKEQTEAPHIDKERFPMVVEFAATRQWQQVVATLDKLIGVEGKLDTNLVDEGVLRRVYRFPSRDARQQAMVKVRTETTGVDITHPGEPKPREEEPKAPVEMEEIPPTEKEEEIPPAPPPPDLNQNLQEDPFERQAMVNQWVNELLELDIPRQVAYLSLALKKSNIEFDVDSYVNQLIRMELSFKESVRNSAGKLDDRLYQNLYDQYQSVLKLYNSLLDAVKKAEELPKLGEINPELQKFAQARVSRWLGKQMLSVLRTKDYRTRLAADRYITSTGNALDKFMDVLQQKHASVALLIEKLFVVSESLIGLLDTMISLADMHNSQARIQQLRDKSRRRVSTINIINEQNINKLKKTRADLLNAQSLLKEKKAKEAA